MAVKTIHHALTLRGDNVADGILITDGQVAFSPHWGMLRHNPGLLACSATDGDLKTVHVCVTERGTALVPCEGAPERELVLVEQYSPGAGGKRWPRFSVELGEESRKLADATTSGGSGEERWMIVSAPLGWAENIAAQFVNERDRGGQTMCYKPGLVVNEDDPASAWRDEPAAYFSSQEEEPAESPMAAAMRRAGLI